jgi:hypothetical protein
VHDFDFEFFLFLWGRSGFGLRFWFRRRRKTICKSCEKIEKITEGNKDLKDPFGFTENGIKVQNNRLIQIT